MKSPRFTGSGTKEPVPVKAKGLEQCSVCFESKGRQVKQLYQHRGCLKGKNRDPVCVECFSQYIYTSTKDPDSFPKCVWCSKPVSEKNIPNVLQKEMKRDLESWEEFKKSSIRSTLGREGNATIKCLACGLLHHWKLEQRPTAIFHCGDGQESSGCRQDIDPTLYNGKKKAYYKKKYIFSNSKDPKNKNKTGFCPGCNYPYFYLDTSKEKGCGNFCCPECSLPHCIEHHTYLDQKNHYCPLCYVDENGKKKRVLQQREEEESEEEEEMEIEPEEGPDSEPELLDTEPDEEFEEADELVQLELEPVQTPMQQEQQTMTSTEEQSTPVLDFAKLAAIDNEADFITELRATLTHQEIVTFNEMFISIKEEDNCWATIKDATKTSSGQSVEQSVQVEQRVWDKKKHAAMLTGLYKLVILRNPEVENRQYRAIATILEHVAVKYGRIVKEKDDVQKKMKGLKAIASRRSTTPAKYNIFLGDPSSQPEVRQRSVEEPPRTPKAVAEKKKKRKRAVSMFKFLKKATF